MSPKSFRFIFVSAHYIINKTTTPTAWRWALKQLPKKTMAASLHSILLIFVLGLIFRRAVSGVLWRLSPLQSVDANTGTMKRLRGKQRYLRDVLCSVHNEILQPFKCFTPVMCSLSISVTFVFPFSFSSLGWESLGLSASALKKGAFGRQCWDFGGLGYLHGYCCGKNHSSLTLKNVLVVSERVHFPWFFANASIQPNEQILLRFLFQFMTYL